MSHLKAAHRGLEAVERKDYAAAVDALTIAITKSPNPRWLLSRAKALLALGKFADALKDTHHAWHSAYARNDRASMAAAQYRRGVALRRLGRLADADCCMVYAMRLMKGHAPREQPDPREALVDAQGWSTVSLEDVLGDAQERDVKGALEEMKESPGGPDAAENLGIEEIKRIRESKSEMLRRALDTGPNHRGEWRLACMMRLQIAREMAVLEPHDEARRVRVSIVPDGQGLVDPLKEGDAKKARRGSPPPWSSQFFETMDAVYVTVLARRVDAQKLKVEVAPRLVRLTGLELPSGLVGEYRADLAGEVVPARHLCTITPYKVEVKMYKTVEGRWGKLSNSADPVGRFSLVEAAPAANTTQPETTTITSPPEPTSTSQPSTTTRAYPTSSRTGPKDWDKITADDADDSSASVETFFQSLYKNATPEQQRAMIKSFTESNGTSLSTDWDNVRSGPVATVPPEGAEAKPWN